MPSSFKRQNERNQINDEIKSPKKDIRNSFSLQFLVKIDSAQISKFD